MNVFNAISIPGHCDVCGCKIVLKVKDACSELLVGDCCYGALHFTHAQLQLIMNMGVGIRHPKPGEFASRDNH